VAAGHPAGAVRAAALEALGRCAGPLLADPSAVGAGGVPASERAERELRELLGVTGTLFRDAS